MTEEEISVYYRCIDTVRSKHIIAYDSWLHAYSNLKESAKKKFDSRLKKAAKVGQDKSYEDPAFLEILLNGK